MSKNCFQPTKSEVDCFNNTYNEWESKQVSLGHLSPSCKQYHPIIREYLNKEYKFREGYDYLLRSDGSDGLGIHFHTGICNVDLIFNIIKLLHVPLRKYDLCGLSSNGSYTVFTDYVCLIIRSECLPLGDYQTTL